MKQVPPKRVWRPATEKQIDFRRNDYNRLYSGFKAAINKIVSERKL